MKQEAVRRAQVLADSRHSILLFHSGTGGAHQLPIWRSHLGGVTVVVTHTDEVVRVVPEGLVVVEGMLVVEGLGVVVTTGLEVVVVLTGLEVVVVSAGLEVVVVSAGLLVVVVSTGLEVVVVSTGLLVVVSTGLLLVVVVAMVELLTGGLGPQGSDESKLLAK